MLVALCVWLNQKIANTLKEQLVIKILQYFQSEKPKLRNLKNCNSEGID
ncbi:hypothetical protein B4117_1739 [Bacillus mycoides]|nr:hypothetical protein B4117_1739 [Bacillus mycoides]